MTSNKPQHKGLESLSSLMGVPPPQGAGQHGGSPPQGGGGQQYRPNQGGAGPRHGPGGGGPPRGRGGGDEWTQGYLRDDYFERSPNGNEYLRVDLVTGTAQEIARSLSGGRMKTHQVRRFYQQVRLLERMLRIGADFDGVWPKLNELKPAAASAVTRGVAPQVFQTFIDRNVDTIGHDRRKFVEGFVRHFQAVVAYLPKDRR